MNITSHGRLSHNASDSTRAEFQAICNVVSLLVFHRCVYTYKHAYQSISQISLHCLGYAIAIRANATKANNTYRVFQGLMAICWGVR